MHAGRSVRMVLHTNFCQATVTMDLLIEFVDILQPLVDHTASELDALQQLQLFSVIQS